jgi:thioredoxin 1
MSLVKNINDDEFQKEVLESNKIVLVDFWAEWCGPCKAMAPILKQVKDIQGDKVRIIKVDVDKNNALAMKYSIQSVPTLMIFKNGKQLWRQSGVIEANELNKIVEMFK